MLPKYLDPSLEENNKLQKVLDGLRYFNAKQFDIWFDKLPGLLNFYIKKYSLHDFKFLNSGRLGLLFQGYSNFFNEEVIVKVIPEFLYVFNIELSAYLKLPKIYMCPLLDYNKKDNVLILKKLSGMPFNLKDDKDSIINFLHIVDNNKVLAKSDDIKYIDVFEEQYKSIKNKTLLKDFRVALHRRVKKYYKRYENEKLYLIHGDLHSGNVIWDNGTLKAIDPLGYAAPYIFTFARFINISLLYSSDINETYNYVIEMLSSFINKNEFIPVMIIDNFFCLCSLIYEIENPDKYVLKMKSIIDFLIEKLEGENY